MKSSNVKYETVIKQGYDPSEGYFYYIEFPDDLLVQLDWNERSKLIAEIKLGVKGNVIVISKEQCQPKT